MELLQYKQTLDAKLATFLENRQANLALKLQDQRILGYTSYSKDITLAGGKRVRPFLVSCMSNELSTEALKQNNGVPNISNPAIGLELFHVFALIHDDIIDKGDTRHGIPTLHKQFGVDQAILVGDLLFSWASDCFANTPAQAEFSHMVDDVVLGQMLDVDCAKRPLTEIAPIDRKMYLKTASYTFIRPMRIGLALAQAEPQAFAAADTFGEHIGLAFQLQDDLLDIYGDASTIAKPTMGDIREHQRTAFTEFILTNGTEQEKALLASVLGKQPDEQTQVAIKNLFTTSGAEQHIRTRIQQHLAQAADELEKAPWNTDCKRNLSSLLRIIQHRTQ